jgi:hypothetical protein
VTHLTTIDAVLAALGEAAATAPVAQLSALLPAADAAIQRYCGRQWLTGAIVGEAYEPEGDHLYLQQRPVASVEAVQGRRAYDATVTTLVLGTDYEVRDLARGLLVLNGSGAREWPPQGAALPALPRSRWSLPYSYLTVSYTPAATVPADVALAATQLVAHWLTPTLHPEYQGLKSLSLAQGEIAMTVADTTATPGAAGWPAPVLGLLAPYRAALTFA